MLRQLKVFLDVLIFLLTIVMVVYGIYKGFNFIELVTNLGYFSALLIKMTVDFMYDSRK
ncbi:MAG TPA: hypothetical protein VJI32_04295 [Candidatus Nanoarchaeia archaeon]|nr:hypothetical protein [Candidatus Nanoarchaeia archaeon]